MTGAILVVMEVDEAGKVLPGSLEALSTGRQVSEKTGQALSAVLVGSSVTTAAEKLKPYVSGPIYVAEEVLDEVSDE